MYNSLDLAIYEKRLAHSTGLSAAVSKETWEKRKAYTNGLKFDTLDIIRKEGGVLTRPLKVKLNKELRPVEYEHEDDCVISDIVPFIFSCQSLGTVVVEFDSRSKDSNDLYDRLSYANALWKTIFVSCLIENPDSCKLLYCYKSLVGHTSRLIDMDYIDYDYHKEKYCEFIDSHVSNSFGVDSDD